jgi:hypothetical protein
MNGHNGVERVVRPGEQRLGLQFVDQFAQRVDIAPQFSVDILAFLRQFEVGGNVIAAPAEIGVGSKQVLQTLLLAHYLLRSLRIRPQIRVGGLLFDFG